MSHTKRQHPRFPVVYEVTLYWEDPGGRVYTFRARTRDSSESGMCIESETAIEATLQPGTRVFLDVPSYQTALEAEIRYCVHESGRYRIGLRLSNDGRSPMPAPGEVDYYEILQLSYNADPETIHRVYRIMAQRYHPDNPDSGDQARFLLLTEAHRVLSDPERRAQYDFRRGTVRRNPMPVFQSKAFVDDKEGEMNRRLGILCLLYAQRRRNPDRPSITLLELEELMAIPREYLEFTLWYLRQKKYVEVNSGADFSLTASGVDFVEENTPANDLLRNLIASAAMSSSYGPTAPMGQSWGSHVQ